MEISVMIDFFNKYFYYFIWAFSFLVWLITNSRFFGTLTVILGGVIVINLFRSLLK